MAFIYDAGTISVTAGATAATGILTAFNAVVREGDVLLIGGVASPVTADPTTATGLTIKAWPGPTLTNTAYSILLFSPRHNWPVDVWERVRKAFEAQPELPVMSAADGSKLLQLNSGGTALQYLATSALPISTATQTALNGKSSTGHTHAIADVTSLQTTLDGKAGLGANTFTGQQRVGASGVGSVWFSPGNANFSGYFEFYVANGTRAGFFGYIPAAGGQWSYTAEGVCTGFDFNKQARFAGNILPMFDNLYSIGGPSNRATAVYAVNGTIQTSDGREKTVDQRIGGSAASALVSAIDPVLFRWNVGGGTAVQRPVELDADGNPKPLEYDVTTSPGERLHAGFIAQEVKASLDAAGLDFAAWGLDDKADPDSRQWVNMHELLPVLWAALRSALDRIEALENASSNSNP